jgi:RNA polymerase sigma-70 factor (ECF subfamily)
VEDLVQETLLAMHTRRDTYDPQRPFTAWAYAIARYKMIDRLRGRARAEALQDELVDDAFSVAPSSRGERQPARPAALLDRLPPGSGSRFGW